MFAFMHTEFSLLVFFLSLFVRNSWSLGIEFTAPLGGSTWPSGTFSAAWSDAGGSPSMRDLSTYKLELIVGGKNAGDSTVLVTIGKPEGMVADGSVTGDIPALSAQSIQNGFYLRMTSNTTKGNQVINYSERFTLINMSGTTASQYLEGANANAGDVSNVPEAQYNVISHPSPTASATSTTSSSFTIIAPVPTDTTTRTPDHADRPDGGGLSKVALGLIVMGSILAVIGAVSIVVWILFFYRRIRRKREASKALDLFPDDHAEPTYLGSKTELAAYRSSRALSPPSTPSEMSAERDAQEVSAIDKAVEVPGSPLIYELEGDLSLYEAGSGRRSQAWAPI